MGNVVKSARATVKGLEQAFVWRRRDLVRSCLARGLRIPEIIAFLEKPAIDENGNPVPSSWFPSTFTEHQKFELVKKDVKAVNIETGKAHVVAQAEADGALVRYLERQRFLYERAVSDGNYVLARLASQDIAKAEGVDVERPTKVELDVASLMRTAFVQAREKKQVSPPPIEIENATVIEPEPTPAQPPADAAA